MGFTPLAQRAEPNLSPINRDCANNNKIKMAITGPFYSHWSQFLYSINISQKWLTHFFEEKFRPNQTAWHPFRVFVKHRFFTLASCSSRVAKGFLDPQWYQNDPQTVTWNFRQIYHTLSIKKNRELRISTSGFQQFSTMSTNLYVIDMILYLKWPIHWWQEVPKHLDLCKIDI